VDPEEIAAVILEPILGEGGFIVPPPDFLPWLREWTTRHGALLVVDEIQTGFGRTGRMFSVEHFGVRPDLVVAGKSIADGLPLSTVMGDREIMGHLPSGLLGGTYGGNPLALAAAHAVLDTIEKEDLLSRAVGQGKELKARLLSMQNRVAQIGDVRGIGAMVGVEFVTDRESRGPNSPFLQRVIRRALENGVLLLKAGQYGHVLRFLAPLNTPVDMLDEAMDVLEETLTVSAIRA
jgi:4-aminobutyrate aminotransferase/(S)-3-amino-2-methylpropionate transaminase